ncbi:DUF6571 family protein [Streptomyces sp. B6B3]|uniref:DUF6571 family protein n=1 Tax=Streptomyces sp. B6B3 TaxID=3153570 RepID=UPI00325D175E
MGETNSANPEHLDQLADKLCPAGDGATYGALANAFDRARNLDASAQMSSLAPLLSWLMDTAGQLRDKADLLRGDMPAVDYTDIMYGDGTADVETDPYAAFEVLGQDNIDAFLELARDGELTDADIAQMASLLGAYADNPDFAAALVDQMGMDNFLELSQQIQDRAGEMEDPHDANRLRADMATILTGAFWLPGNIKEGDEGWEEWSTSPQYTAHQERLAAFQSLSGENAAEAGDLVNDVIDDVVNDEDIALLELDALNEFLTHVNNVPLSGDFNRALMSEISPEGLVQLAERLPELAGTADEALRSGFTDLQTNVANSLASATDVGKPPSGDPTYVHWENTSQAQWYNDFMADFYEVGRGTYEVTFTEDRAHGMVNTRGYQMLLNMMEEGNGYSTGFLVDVAEDVQAAETEDEYFWDHYGPMDRTFFDVGTPESRIAMDPMEGVLGIMGQHPDAATEYLSNEENLDWLIARDWSHPLVPEGEHGLPGFDYSGFGDAMEAATTGRPAGSDAPFARTAEGDQIMREVMERFSDDEGALITDDGPYVDLRSQLGTMSAAFMPDIQHSLTGIDLHYDGNPPTLLNDVDVDYFLFQVGRDPDAYAAITGAQQAYTTIAVDVAMNHIDIEDPSTADRINLAVTPGATVAGIMSSARADSIRDGIVESDEAFNSRLGLAEEVAGLVIEETTGRIPVLGGAVGWGANKLTGSITDQFERDSSQQAYEEGDEQWQSGRNATIASAEHSIEVAAGEGRWSDESIIGFQNGVDSTIFTKYNEGANLHWDAEE